MTKKPTSRTNNDAMPTPTQGVQTSAESTVQGDLQKDHQGIFDERFSLFMDKLGETCEMEHVNTAICIVDDPKCPNFPLVYTRGHQYDVAAAMAHVLRRIKQKIAEELDA